MKKNILFLIVAIICISACEKDDFCIQNPVTPNLVLRFYDDIDRETLKEVDSLYVWSEGLDTIFSNASTDSIFIPLNSLDTLTNYKFSKGRIVNTFTVKYIPQEEYVSRSCGFKVIFNEVLFASDSTWITDFTPSTLTTIDNENAAHVQIFH